MTNDLHLCISSICHQTKSISKTWTLRILYFIMARADVGDRIRLFFLGTTISIWLFIVDGLGYTTFVTVDEYSEFAPWARYVLSIFAYLFSMGTFSGCFMLLFWLKPHIGGLVVSLTCFVAGSMRLVATLAGFKDFWRENDLDSTVAGTTDVVIAALQGFIMVDAIRLYRISRKRGYVITKSSGQYHRVSMDCVDEDSHEEERQRREDDMEEPDHWKTDLDSKPNPFGGPRAYD